jgi:prolyl-tRNA synthetase, family II
MRQSSLFVNTLRDAPSEAEAASHQLLLRGGFIRQLAAGVYSYLPLGWRVLRKIESIVREELERAGAQELLMPALQPAELWRQSGRYSVYGPELIRLKDRHDREFALGPTHEEVIASLVKNEIGSYRKLPVTLFQIQTKFRDERRPRFGLLRGREFLMKDAYSFDTSWEGLDRSYKAMYKAYARIFERCGLNFKPVEADAGAIGGEGGTHEFMALAEIGEDTIATCGACDYSANLEKAKAGPEEAASPEADEESAQPIHTPGARTIEEVARFLQIEPKDIIKTLIYLADNRPVAVLLRGDHEANEVKLKNVLGVEELALADAATTAAVTGAPTGFVGPIGLQIPILADSGVLGMGSGTAGANKADYHCRNVVPGRDFSVERTGDFRNAKEGDRCPHCEAGTLQFHKGIELGHVFKLGTKYSEALNARFLDSNGREQTMIMGCYGIGLSRVMAAVAEQKRDERGLIWPLALAPFQAHIIPVSSKNETQMRTAEELYGRLRSLGIEAILDDREERAGVKFNDSDLFGIPVRIVVGKDAENGRVEFIERGIGESEVIAAEEAVSRILNLYSPKPD